MWNKGSHLFLRFWCFHTFHLIPQNYTTIKTVVMQSWNHIVCWKGTSISHCLYLVWEMLKYIHCLTFYHVRVHCWYIKMVNRNILAQQKLTIYSTNQNTWLFCILNHVTVHVTVLGQVLMNWQKLIQLSSLNCTTL